MTSVNKQVTILRILVNISVKSYFGSVNERKDVTVVTEARALVLSCATYDYHV